mgnify:CR=1 FL=1
MKMKLTKKNIAAIQPPKKSTDIYDTDIKGFKLRVSPAGGMTYYVQYNLPGKPRQHFRIGSSSVWTPDQAREKAKKVLGMAADNQDPMAELREAKAKASEMTFVEFLDQEYKPWMDTNRRSGDHTYQRLTYLFKDFFGSKKLTEITAWDVEKWKTVRSKAGLKASTTNRDLTALRGLFSRAVEWGRISETPMPKVKNLEEDSEGRIRWLDGDEETRFWRALEEREALARGKRDSANEWRLKRHLPPYPSLDNLAFTDHLYPICLIVMNTGLRRKELLTLERSSINLERRALTVAGLSGKAKDTRHIPLNDDAYRALAGWIDDNGIDSGPLFLNKDGKPIHDVRSSWDTLLRDAKIEDFRFHDMRHHFASMLVMNGVDIYTVKTLLGHKKIEMTMRYAHLAPEHNAAAVNTLTKRSKGNVSEKRRDHLRLASN